MFSFRQATLSDSLLIRDLASKTWGHTYGSILDPEQLDYMFEMMYSIESLHNQMTEKGHRFFIISVDNKPAGYLSIEQKEADLFNFQKIYSLPQMHGTGIGRFIIEQGIAYLKNIHSIPFTIELYVNRNNPAVGFYTHMGFHKIATRDHAIGNGFYMNDFIMKMEINN